MEDSILFDKAFSYANKVVDGTYIATKYVKKQCQSFLDEYEKCKNEDHKYIFDETDIYFAEDILATLIFASGDGVGGLPVLEGIADFQCFILVNFFGFKHRDDISKRKIQTMILLIARKNAKTWICAIIILLLLLLEEDCSEFYSVSVDSTLSGIVKKQLDDIIRKSAISQHFDKKYGRINCKINDSYYMNLHGDADRLDGRRICAAILDECGLYKDTKLIDAMQTGMLSVKNKTTIFISTAYATDSEIFPNQIKYLEQVLDGEIDDETIFGLLYRCEDPEKWDTDEAMYQANPMCYSSKGHIEYLQRQREKAKNIPDQLEGYKTKHMNIFLPKNSSEAYLTDEDIKQCIIDDYDFTGKEVILGLDLANSIDNSALSIATYDEELEKYIVKSVAFIPSDRCYEKEKIEKVPYYAYSEKEWCYLTGNRVIDYNFIENKIDELNEQCIVKAIALDRAYGQNIIQNLEDKGYKLIEISQGFIGMNNSTRWFRELVYDQKVQIVRNNLFIMNLKNAKTVKNTTEQLMVSKKHSIGKVDMTVATLNIFAYIVEVEQKERNGEIKDLYSDY